MTDDAPGPEPLPRVDRVQSLVFAQTPVGWRWSAGFRAAATVGIPGAALVAAGYAHVALFATFGAFAALYGEGRAYRVRAQVVGTAGLALLAAVALGGALGTVVPTGGIAVQACAVLLVTIPAVIAVYVIDALRLGPPGALFFALVGSGAVVAVEAGADPVDMLIAAVLGAGTSIVVSMAGVLRDPSRPQREAAARAIGAVDAYIAADGAPSAPQRHAAGAALMAAWSTVDDARAERRPADAALVASLRDANRRFVRAADDADDTEFDPTRDVTNSRVRPSVRYRLRRSVSPSSHAAITAARVGSACLAAGAASSALGFDRPHWAAIGALVVLQAGDDRVHGTVRALHRFLGTIVGVVLFAGLHTLAPSGYALIALIAVLVFAIEMFVARNYAVAVVFITPVALLASGSGSALGPTGAIVRDRLLETAIGVIVALLAMYLAFPKADRRTFAWTEHRVRGAASNLISIAAAVPAANPGARSAARHLHFELEGCVRAGIDSAHNDPEWTAAHWPRHADLVHRGYDLVAEFWTTARDRPLDDGAARRTGFE